MERGRSSRSGPVRSFAIRRSVSGVASGGESAHDLTSLVPADGGAGGVGRGVKGTTH